MGSSDNALRLERLKTSVIYSISKVLEISLRNSSHSSSFLSGEIYEIFIPNGGLDFSLNYIFKE